MSESLKELSLFCEVFEHGGFAKAAEELDLTPSAVSKAIARLEERLTVRLFIRSTRMVKPTEAGIEFYRRGKDILNAMEEAETLVGNLGSDPSGDLHVAASDAFAIQVIVPMLGSFQAAYPRINVHLSQGDGPIDLLKEDYDVAIRFEEPGQKTLSVRPLTDDPWVVCAAPEYLDRHSRPKQPKDLPGHRCLAIRARGRLDKVWVFKGGKRNTITVNPVFSGIGMMVRSAALQGLGVARLASFLVKDDFAHGRLVPLLADYQPLEQRRIYAVTPGRRSTPRKTQAFIDALSRQIQEQPPE